MIRVAAEQTIEDLWHCMASDEAMLRLGAAATGLTTAQAVAARAKFGRNAIAEDKPPSAWAIFFSQFKNILIWILISASVVSGALGDAADSVVIIAVVLLNALVGFFQEYSAEKSIAALKQMTAPSAKVWRDGAVTTVAAADVVPGDLLELDAGDLVAADARLLSAASLSCVEAILTGEAEPVAKRVEALDEPELPIGDRVNMVFMGTSIATGSGRAIVVATAMGTEIGRIASLIATAGEDEETPLQAKLDRFGRVLLWATLAIVALLFALGLLRGEPVVELFMTSVSLAVAALPESLPAVVTAALSLGVMRMSRRRALVRRLAAVETLGATNVICTDKTGTLTVGQMTVRAMFVAGEYYEVTGEGYGTEGEVRGSGAAVDPGRDGALRQMADILVGCNNAHIERDRGGWRVIGDPTEGALLCAGVKAGGDRNALERDWPKIDEIPFDSERKLHSVLRRNSEGQLRVLANGAPEALLAKCSRVLRADGVHPLTAADKENIVRQNTHLADQGLRVLGSAFRELETSPQDPLVADAIERELVFVGLAGLHDPPRAEAREAVAKCRAAGIRVVMITGDHPRTAIAIAKELGFADGRSATGGELNQLSDEALQRLIPSVAVYARVTAGHKLRIVRAWQANDAVVAMTGDGVNDAPAIKGADIGVAMGRTGTEVTKQASDMIVTDDNFATIVDAVEEGRGIYENIRKTLHYLLACNASELALMTICIVSGLPAPLLPIHLLWINLVTDGPPALCLAADRLDPGLMNARPRERGEQLADEGFLWTMLLTATLVAGVSFLTFLHGLRLGGVELARTYAFAVMVFAQLLLALGARSPSTPVWRLNPLSNPHLLIALILSVVVQFWSHHDTQFAHLLRTAQLSFRDSLLLLAVSALPLVVLEVAKLAAPSVAKDGRKEARPMRRWAGSATAVVFAVTAAGGWYYWPRPGDAPTSFVTHAIERGTVRRVVTATGVVRPPPKIAILATATGAVQFRDCEIGAKVTKDLLCATIDHERRSLAVNRERAGLEVAQARLKQCEAKLARAATALARARGSADRSKIEGTTGTYNRALARARRCRDLVAQRETRLRATEADLKRAEVRAPENGIVVSRGVETGQKVEAGVSPIFSMANPAVAQIEVSTTRAEEVKIGDLASVDVEAAPRRSFDARVTQIERARNVIILSAPDAERAVEAGMTATARIEVDRRDDALRAPNAAVRYSRSRGASEIGVKGAESGATLLWVLRNGRPTPVAARLGLDDGAHTEIVTGALNAGDELIIDEKIDARPD